MRIVVGGLLVAATASGCVPDFLLSDSRSERARLGAPPPHSGDTGSADTPGNVLVILIDDVGVDKLGLYGVTETPTPQTPVLDTLASEGVLFRSAYANPICSPTRASLLTGRHPYQHGIGAALSIHGDFALPYDEITIPEMLDRKTDHRYDHSAVGKWHLGTNSFDAYNSPNLQGFDWYAGAMENLGAAHNATDLLLQTYFDYEKTTNGEVERVEKYATSETIDDAIDRMGAMTEPWFLYVAFNAAHAPYHLPPVILPYGPGVGHDNKTRYYNYMVEAIDREIGRLLDAMTPEQAASTTVWVMGDNGTPHDVIAPDQPGRAKGTVYEAGVNVPMIVTGPYVEHPGTESTAFVTVQDVFVTVAEIAGATLSADELADLDSVSILPYLADPDTPSQREHVYVERFFPAGPPPHIRYERMARDTRWKLREFMGRADQLYDMDGTHHEGEDLLASGVELTDEQQEAYDRLKGLMPTPLE